MTVSKTYHGGHGTQKRTHKKKKKVKGSEH